MQIRETATQSVFALSLEIAPTPLLYIACLRMGEGRDILSEKNTALSVFFIFEYNLQNAII
ncbi:hypothetical protein HQ46_03785 [Porphyromonas gulae]|nr:hypothetical protein HQ46_03785 [Porphyromonas gulae]